MDADPPRPHTEYYQVFALPQSFVIDRNGIIVSREFGAAAWDRESSLARFRELLR